MCFGFRTTRENQLLFSLVSSLPSRYYPLIEYFDFTYLCEFEGLYANLLRKLPNLATLKFNEELASPSHELDNSQFRSLFSYISKVRSLSLENCDSLTGDAFTNLRNLAPQLISLKIKNCKNINLIFEMLIPLSSQLKSLTIEGVPLQDRSALSRFLMQATAMKELLLPEKCHVSGSTLETFFQNNPSLTSLSLTNQPHMTNRNLYSLSTHCPRLTELDVSGCEQLTIDGVITVVQRCKKISSLSLRQIPGIGHETLNAIKRIRPPLLLLDIRGCEAVTDVSIKALKWALPPNALILHNTTSIPPSFPVHAHIVL